MKICGMCGRTYKDSIQFCEDCGLRLGRATKEELAKAAARPAQPAAVKTSGKSGVQTVPIVAGIAAVFIIIAVVAAFLVFSSPGGGVKDAGGKTGDGGGSGSGGGNGGGSGGGGGGSGGADGRTIVLAALDKQPGIARLDAEYSLSSSGSQLGTVHYYQLGSDQRFDQTTDDGESKTYQIGADAYACYKTGAQWSCSETTILGVNNPTKQKPALSSWISKGAVAFGPVTSKTIVGRECDEVIMTITVSKLTVEDLGLAPDTDFSILRTYRIVECFDRQNGAGLRIKTTLVAERSGLEMTIDTDLQATSFNTAAQVPAATFTLPTTPRTTGSLSNPGFEDGLTDWNTYGSPLAMITASEKRSGAKAAYVEDESDAEWNAQCQEVGVVPYETVRASVWAKTNSGTLSFWLTTVTPGEGGGDCVGGLDGGISAAAWREYSVTCQPSTDTINVCVGSGSLANTGAGWFDDANITHA